MRVRVTCVRREYGWVDGGLIHMCTCRREGMEEGRKKQHGRREEVGWL